MIELIWVLFAISIIIITVSFIMSPNANAFSGALVGSSDLDLFKESKEKGFKKFLKYLMFSCGLALMLFSIIARAVM